jgi:crooked neck
MPELIWKSYIDFEISQKNYENTRKLYKKLIERTKHVKVYSSYAEFEISVKDIDAARNIFKEAYLYFKSGSFEEDTEEIDIKEQRLLLLENWKKFEIEHGDKNTLKYVEDKIPKKIKKKRAIDSVDGIILLLLLFRFNISL